MSLSTPRFGGNDLGLPAPAPLPNLRDALAKRAAIFGPIDVEGVRASPKGWRAAIGSALRRMADLLEPQVALPSLTSALAARQAVFGPNTSEAA